MKLQRSIHPLAKNKNKLSFEETIYFHDLKENLHLRKKILSNYRLHNFVYTRDDKLVTKDGMVNIHSTECTHKWKLILILWMTKSESVTYFYQKME